MEKTEKYRCPLCDTLTGEKVWEKEGYYYYACPRCDMYFLGIPDKKEVLNQNMEIYEDAGKGILSGREPLKRGKVSKYRKILKTLEPFRGEGRIMDVGCGQGGFLATAKELGWQPEGVELSPKLADLVSQTYGIPVHKGLIEELELPENHYDVIFFNELLEHVFEPRSFLKRVYQLLRPGGVFFLRTRNHRSFSAAWCQENWKELTFLEKGHVCFYSPFTFQTILPQLGFCPLSIRTWGVSLHAPYRRGSLPFRLAKITNKILEPFSRMLNKGHRIEVVAQKEK